MSHKNKITLHTAANCMHINTVELEPGRILCNDVILPLEFNPHNKRLWVIGNVYGPVCAVWADGEQDALDEMVDAGMGDSFLVSNEDAFKMDEAERDELAQLGNAGEYADLTDAWMAEVVFEPSRDWQLLCKFAEARGSSCIHLGDV
jgi:hypothetical protein